jgi:hypothetical protein
MPLRPPNNTAASENASFSRDNIMASSYDNYIDDFMRLSGQALTNNNPSANIPQTRDNQNAMDASLVDQRNQNITAVSSSNQNNQNNIAAAAVDQRNQNITDTSSVNRIYKPNTTLSIYQNNKPKAVPSLRQTHKPTKPTPLRQNITSASLHSANGSITGSNTFSTKSFSQDNLGIPVPMYPINGPSTSTIASTASTSQTSQTNQIIQTHKPHSPSQTTNDTLAIKPPKLTIENPNLAIESPGQKHTGKGKQNLTNKNEQNLDDRDKQSININGNLNFNNKDKRIHNIENEQSTNNNGILNSSLTTDYRLHPSTLVLAMSDERNPNLNNRGNQSLNNAGNLSLTNTHEQTFRHPSKPSTTNSARHPRPTVKEFSKPSTTNSARHPRPTVKELSSSALTSSSITNPHDSTSSSAEPHDSICTSTNGSTTDSSSSVEDPNPESPSTPPPSPLPVFDHVKIFDPNHQTKPYIDPRYDPSLTLAQRLEASTDLPLAPFSDYEWKKENEYVYLTSWQPPDRRGRNTRLGEY